MSLQSGVLLRDGAKKVQGVHEVPSVDAASGGQGGATGDNSATRKTTDVSGPVSSRGRKIGGGLRGPPEERFAAKVQRAASGCLEWQGCINSRGYGVFIAGGRGSQVLAHRWNYERHVGPIPNGLTIDHLCANKVCVEPSHLEPVTAEENVKRWAQKITHCRNGHELSGGNLIRKASGRRNCRACLNANRRRKTERRRHATSLHASPTTLEGSAR